MQLIIIAVVLLAIPTNDITLNIFLGIVAYLSLDGMRLIPFKRYLYDPVRGKRPGEKVYSDGRDINP